MDAPPHAVCPRTIADDAESAMAMLYGLGLLRSFAFERWFTFVDPRFTWLGPLDAVGNVVMLALSVVGWRKAGLDEYCGGRGRPACPVDQLRDG
jgi:hypothetical protein